MRRRYEEEGDEGSHTFDVAMLVVGKKGGGVEPLGRAWHNGIPRPEVKKAPIATPGEKTGCRRRNCGKEGHCARESRSSKREDLRRGVQSGGPDPWLKCEVGIPHARSGHAAAPQRREHKVTSTKRGIP